MSDRTRTEQAGLGSSPDVALDGLGRQLFVLARVGLLPAKILERQRASEDLAMVLELVTAPSPRDQAQALIDLLARAADELGDGPLGESVRRLYGTEPGERGLPYQRRHAAAAYAWDADIEVASYDRRYRRLGIQALQHQLLLLRREQERQTLQATLTGVYLPPPMDPSEDRPNVAFRRLGFSAEAHILSGSRSPAYTDWRYHDIAVTGREQRFRVFTQVEAKVALEPLDDTVTIERSLGANRFGYQVWLVRFRELPELGQEIRWGVRKHFLPPRLQATDHDWLSLAASQPGVIAEGRFTVNYDNAGEQPARFAKFITPKMTLPNLRGPVWPLPPPNEHRQTVTFELLTPWHSHGIYWWWNR